MKNIAVLILALCTTLAAPFGSAQGKQDQGKKIVEQPLKKALAPVAEKFDLARMGIEWNKGLEAALNKGKPILLFQLLGNFDDVYC